MTIHNPHILILSIAVAFVIAGAGFYAVVSAVIEWRKFKAGYFNTSPACSASAAESR